MDALLSTSAFQLLGGTGDGRTAFFVFIVEAVVVSVADPGLRDAAAIIARELGRIARHVDAAHLVGRVSAVVIRVAPERVGDAPAGITLELVC